MNSSLPLVMLAEVRWRYRVKYALGVVTTDGMKATAWHRGVLVYYPAEQRAVLLEDGVSNDDAPPATVDEGVPVSAGFLRAGGRLVLNKTTVSVVSGVLGEAEDGQQEESGLELDNGNPPAPSPPNPCADASDCARWHEVMWTKDVNKKNKIWHDGRMCHDGQLAIFYAAGDSNDDDRGGEHMVNDRDGRGGNETKVPGLRPLYRKVYKEGAPREGDVLECARLTIEIGPLLRSDTSYVGTERATAAIVSRAPLASCTTETSGSSTEEAPLRTFEVLYSEDRRTKRIKKWCDGRAQWDPRSGRATFWGEEGQVLLAGRATAPDELGEGYEISTGRYVLQMGAEQGVVVAGPERALTNVRSRRSQENVRPSSRSGPPDRPNNLPVPASAPATGGALATGHRGRSASALLALLAAKQLDTTPPG